MKKLKFLGVMAMAALLFTSCLDGGNNEQSGAAIGVVDFSMEAMKNLAYVNDYTALYSPQFESLTTGDCIVFPYTINYDDPMNSGTNKYLTATVAGYNKLDEGLLVTTVDTADIRKNEITTMDASVISSDGTGYGCGTVKNYLFLSSSHPNISSDQKNMYELQYDPSQTPKEVEGKRVYDFFLRVVKQADGKGTVGTNTLNYVFRAGSAIEMLKSKEKADNQDVLYIRLNYIKEFNKDTTAATWGTSKLMGFPILKETTN
ncbi:hypothetical protein DXD68_06245 [Parabacteroides sp. TM07-1AC]|jgi:hypothetical protein|uniref:hypothetical protein n=1 Tax=Parabacteroides sp. TM07-1AC TaxID=2292363 RepID=UPI000EFDC9F5|nr:hypothetical protein [Parabacteroides sp. TM07-1AC]RHU29055.1 hypothetical protein DXD68_06245 [Parabacteroides sp. TM07-1AC]